MTSQHVRYISAAAFISCLLLMIESCKLSVKPGYVVDDKKFVGQEIEKLHGRFNAGNFETIRNEAAPGLQQVVSKKDFLTILNNEHDDCGNFKNIIDKRISVIVRSPVEVRVIANSQFDKAVLTEMLTFIKVGDEMQLAGYTIARGPVKLPDIGQ